MVLQETKIRLSKTVLLRDAFTGEPVFSGIRIHVPFGGKMEKKQGGYFLFVDVSAPEFEVEIESPIYQRRKICLKSDAGKEPEEVLMYPSPAYPRRAEHTAVRGRARPGSICQFHMENEKESCRLLGDYKRGENSISFYLKGRLSSPLWYIRRKQETSGIYLTLKDIAEDAGPYPLKEPLGADYFMKDTVIYPALESMADEKGDFYLLLPKLSQEKSLLYYSCGEQGKEECGKTEIFQGRENYISKED